MKVLVICQYYYPEPFRIADVCEELVKRGHEVTVITGLPNYPMGEIYSGYEKGQKRDEIINGVKIHRCFTIGRKGGSIKRLLNYFSYAISSSLYVRRIQEEFNVVFVNQLSPVMMASAGIAYKKKYGKKIILYCLDLWPESLCVGGIKKSSIVYKVFERISRRIYRSADEILIASQMFRQYLIKKFDIVNNKISYLPQYAEAQFLELKPKEPSETFNLMFAGNIGTAQSVATVIKAAELLKDEKAVFHIVGDGIELEKLKKSAAGLPNVIFYGRKPLEEMPRYYEMADAMLVTLTDDPIISMTLPGKVQTYMAAGKPIIGAIDGETALVLNRVQGGYCGNAGDSNALAENIQELIKSEMIREIGNKNREYYLNVFSKKKFIKELERHLINT